MLEANIRVDGGKSERARSARKTFFSRIEHSHRWKTMLEATELRKEEEMFFRDALIQFWIQAASIYIELTSLEAFQKSFFPDFFIMNNTLNLILRLESMFYVKHKSYSTIEN